MRKRFTAVLLALVLCLGLSAPAFAAANIVSGSCGQFVIWTFDKGTGTLTVSGTGGMDPSWDAGTAVGGKEAIRSVVIREGVTSIGGHTFEGCVNLSQVSMAGSVTRIGADAFAGTLWLRSLGEFAIVNRILLKYQGGAQNVAIPAGVVTIAPGAFQNNTAIVSVSIPEGVASIGAGDTSGDVFRGCTSLASVAFPASLTGVGRFSFDGTSWLAKQKGDFVMAGSVLLLYRGKGGAVAIPGGASAVADGAFSSSGAVTSLTVPVSVAVLNAEQAFFGVPLEQLPQKVTYLGNKAQWAGVKGTDYLSDPAKKIAIHYAGVVNPAAVFTDMEPNAFYLDGVAWAVQQEITTGKTATTFAPKENCTHGQILTFLWRAAGKPSSSITTPFSMKGDEYYYGAAKWAFEKGMINAAFHPDAFCNRADAVQYIWLAQGRPYAAAVSRFADVPANAYYAQAVAWAVGRGVTTGATASSFNPGGLCNRGQIVTFLYRAYH